MVNHQAANQQPSGWQGFVYVSDGVSDLPSQADVPLDGSENSLNARVFPLSTTNLGDRVRVISLNCGESNSRLMGMGLMPDIVLEVISCTAKGSVIVAWQDQRLGLGAEMAQRIQVMAAAQPLDEPPTPSKTRMTPMATTPDLSMVKLRDANIGATLRVIGYEPTARDYKRKLLAMGLTPGTELRVTRHAPLGDPTEIEVRDFHLSLRKDEADALIVAPVAGGES
ncbi:FeoA family protein [Leptolyngbya sp. 'hensonii']|uniref:FeoA family protein n=1 Tax=Leptolyngbya sp. 'hensonii' TaxID=1922337 RepID=UPI00209BB84F|nr:FeoA family protein [Leptolyngbya sp. 'hensonii']